MENVIKDRPIKLRNLLAYGCGDVKEVEAI